MSFPDIPGGPVSDDEGPTRPWLQWFGRVHNVAASLSQSGTTAQRPTSMLWLGRQYWDTTLNKPIWVQQVTPTVVWVLADGTTA
jgi:hypothetical protein